MSTFKQGRAAPGMAGSVGRACVAAGWVWSALAGPAVHGRAAPQGPAAPATPEPTAPATAGPAETSPQLETVLEALARVREFRDVDISPDGRYAAWTEKLPQADHDERGRVQVAELSTGRTWRVTAAKGRPANERSPAFSPDGRRLAFLSDALSPGQLQLVVAPLEGTTARRVTRAKGALSRPRWAPDGSRVALLYAEGATHDVGPLGAHARDAGVVEEQVATQRVALVEPGSGTLSTVSPEGLFVYDYDWAPDARSLVLEAAPGSGTNNYWIAELYLCELGPAGRTRSLWTPSLQIAQPRFAPDGRSVAVIHGVMSDEGSNGGDVLLVPVSGGEARNLTPGLPASARWLYWLASGELLFAAHHDGGSAVGRVSPAGESEPHIVWSAPEALAALAVARDGTSVAVRHSFVRAPEVWAGELGRWKALTRVNAGVIEWWGSARALRWPSDGQQVQGWLLPPREVEPGRRYPLVVLVHGGPTGAHSAGWPTRWSASLPSQGYYVLLPNPRGSLGFGARFAQANVKDFGHGDLRDILAGVDAALEAAPIDPQRVGLAGWSYGGYMAMWAPTQTTRFKAAVAGAGIANWQSYYGQNKIDRWMLPFFGASVYDDPEVYARSSPMQFIKRHKTPTLVLHGERDSEVPAPQGYELWHALKTLGVPTQLVIYPDEGHAIGRRQHRLDIQRRTVEWFARHLR